MQPRTDGWTAGWDVSVFQPVSKRCLDVKSEGGPLRLPPSVEGAVGSHEAEPAPVSLLLVGSPPVRPVCPKLERRSQLRWFARGTGEEKAGGRSGRRGRAPLIPSNKGRIPICKILQNATTGKGERRE